MTIADIYGYIEKIGSMVFSTIHEDEVHSRIAHFNGYDDEGIYFRTMINKPYYTQLMNTKKITVCGIYPNSKVEHDDEGMALFEPGYSFRLIGEIRNLSFEELKQKANNHAGLQMAVDDALRYTAMKEGNFVVYKAKVEIYDYDFECSTRENKLCRTPVTCITAPVLSPGKKGD